MALDHSHIDGDGNGGESCLVKGLDGRIHIRLFLVDWVFLTGASSNRLADIGPKFAQLFTADLNLVRPEGRLCSC